MTIRWVVTGSLLVIIHLMLSLESGKFAYGLDPLQKPIIFLVSLEVVAGLCYLIGIRYPNRDKHIFIWIILGGLLMRKSMFFSTPMLEDDYYRYLWDGGVVVSGRNPYLYAPEEIRIGIGVEDGIKQIYRSSPLEVRERINHPYLRTIYPPVSQLVFAVAHIIRPWSILGLKIVFLIIDIISLILLYIILRRMEL
ncbi:MAG: hypothetical protein D6828_02900, partial [Nitrospirae bacterium]